MEPSWKVAGSVQEFKRAGKKHVEVQGRDVVILFVDGEFYCLDRRCYHTGGPLELGDIEVRFYSYCSGVADGTRLIDLIFRI